MTTAATYTPRPIKRPRRTRVDIEVIRTTIVEILDDDNPMTCRQLFYQLVSRGVIDKTEAEYKGTVIRLLVEMRRERRIPFHWIADNTRWRRKPLTHSSLGAALEHTSECYRRSLWDDQDVYVEIWLEKDALAGVLLDVTAPWDVPLMVSRGYSSLSYLHGAAENIAEQDKPSYIYFLGDHDPSGQDITRNIVDGICEFAPDAEVHFERVAVTPEQIVEMGLPTRPTKKTDTRSKGFDGDSVDVDAIPPNNLRELAEDCIIRHIDADVWEQTRKIAEEEKAVLEDMVSRVGEGLS